MKKIIVTAFIAGLSFFALESNAQTGTYTDEQGTYRYETREERVWVPERRTGGIFGVGGRTIPGHYETRTNQVKVYDNDRRNREYGEKAKGWEGKHPHGMPPGQRKKQGQTANGNNDTRNRDRNNDGVIDDRDRNYDRNGDSVIDARDRDYDRNNDGVIDSRDRTYKNDDRDDDDDKKNKNSKAGKKGKKNK